MNSIEVSARSVEEALTIALQKLNLTEAEVELEILEEANKGFLGILGQKMAKIKVTPHVDPLALTKEFLEKVTKLMGLEVEPEIFEEEEYIKINFEGEKLGILIGRRGDTLDALQYLTNLVINRYNYHLSSEGERVKIILDVAGYRERREITLVNLAQRMAQKVQQTGRKVVFEPMNPQERRIIHTALQEEANVQTFSEGADPFRRVIIKKV